MIADPAVELAKQIIKHFEGCHLKQYFCPSGKPTIGWGQVIKDGEYPDGITQQKADDLLEAAVKKFTRDVDELVVVPLTVNQKAALISFTYNAGRENFKTSTLRKLLNGGKREDAAGQFLRWIYGDGRRRLPGLERRRKVERYVFQGGSIEGLKALRWFA